MAKEKDERKRASPQILSRQAFCGGPACSTALYSQGEDPANQALLSALVKVNLPLPEMSGCEMVNHP